MKSIKALPLFLLLAALVGCEFESASPRSKVSVSNQSADSDALSMNADLAQINKELGNLSAVDFSYSADVNALKQQVRSIQDLFNQLGQTIDSKRAFEKLEQKRFDSLSLDLDNSADLFVNLNSKIDRLQNDLLIIKSELDARLNTDALASPELVAPAASDRLKLTRISQAFYALALRLPLDARTFLKKKNESIKKSYHDLHIKELYQSSYEQVVAESRSRNESRSESELTAVALVRYQALLIDPMLESTIQREMLLDLPAMNRLMGMY